MVFMAHNALWLNAIYSVKSDEIVNLYPFNVIDS